ncbi:hypothetical protein Tco_0408420 [Tanacetum coccineum]
MVVIEGGPTGSTALIPQSFLWMVEHNDVGETEFARDLNDVSRIIKEGAGPELICTEPDLRPIQELNCFEQYICHQKLTTSTSCVRDLPIPLGKSWMMFGSRCNQTPVVFLSGNFVSSSFGGGYDYQKRQIRLLLLLFLASGLGPAEGPSSSSSSSSSHYHAFLCGS